MRQAHLVGLTALLAIVPGIAAAQTSELYLTGTNGGIVVVQNGAVTRSWTQPRASSAIVVGATVATLGSPAVGGLGYEYTSDGAATGTTFVHPGAPIDQVYDATTDGTYNYLISYASQRVYRTGRDWSSPEELFAFTPRTPARLGIAYDAAAAALWVGSFGTGLVQQFSLSGELRATFSVVPRLVSGLAFDEADGTLWMSGYVSHPNTLFQYAVDGTLLQTVEFGVNEVGTFRVLGGEFGPPDATNTIVNPEPGTVALLAGGLLAVGVAARRRGGARA